jgi:ABC-type transporter Mla subunit MlaD
MPEGYIPKCPEIISTDIIEVEPQDTLSVLSEIINISETTNIKIEPVFEALLPLFRQLGKEEAVGGLEEENEKLRLQLDQANQFVLNINNLLTEFEKLPSLKKIGNLENFCGDLKKIVSGVNGED